MDVRSPAARILKQAYDHHHVREMHGTAIDTENNQIYARTNRNRLVRLNLDVEQLSVLSDDKQRYALIAQLLPGEQIQSGPNLPPMTRDILLPPLTFWQKMMGYLPWAAGAAATVGAGYVVHHWVHHRSPELKGHSSLEAPSDDIDASELGNNSEFATNDYLLNAKPGPSPQTMSVGRDRHPVPHKRMLAADFGEHEGSVGDTQPEVSVGSDFDNTCADEYATYAYDGTGMQWADMRAQDRIAFCATTGVGVTVGLLGAGMVIKGWVIDPIREARQQRAAAAAFDAYLARYDQ